MWFLFILTLGCFGWQMYVHFRYFRLVLKPAPALPTERDLPAVSVIICAKNEEKNIDNLLQNLIAQDYPISRYEIILVNDCSTDRTQEIAENWQKRVGNLVIISIQEVPEGISSKKNALQKGISESKYAWILLTDADCTVGKDWIASMLAGRQDENTQIVLGIAPLLPYSSAFLQQFIQYETFYTALQYAGFALAGKPYMGVGRNLLYHKSLFENIGGFGRFLQTTGGDDDLFINQVATAQNTTVGLYASFAYSAPPLTWRGWYRQKTRHLSVGKHYKSADQRRLALLYASQGGIWLCGLVAVFALPALPALPAWGCLGLFALRTGIVWRDYGRLAGKLGCKVKVAWIPVLDAIFVPYLLVVGGLARFTQKIKWK